MFPTISASCIIAYISEAHFPLTHKHCTVYNRRVTMFNCYLTVLPCVLDSLYIERVFFIMDEHMCW